MTNLEIDRRLALAIGYAPWEIQVSSGVAIVRRTCGLYGGGWYRFDHQAPDTIYPIAEKYKLMPRWSTVANSWWFQVQLLSSRVWHTNPRTCIALAIIEANERAMI